MRIVADANIPWLTKAFGDLGQLTALPTARITNATAREADALIIRNETAVNADLLHGTPVRFVASATAGTDHVDFDYLASAGIGFANAPGCNADSVKEYVIAALLLYAVRTGTALRGKMLGVIGVGAIGSRVARAAHALGMQVLQNDPPLARVTGDAHFVSLEEALTAADFITLHTPLTTTGPDATHHLIDARRLARMKPNAVLINTARGGVVETAALKRTLEQRLIADALIDVWEDEPDIDAGLATRCALATAHVAGYSMEGKLAAVGMTRAAMCRFFGIATDWDAARHLPPQAQPNVTPIAACSTDEAALHDIVRQAYDLEHDDHELRAVLALPLAERAAAYTRLRTRYPERREFSCYTVALYSEQEHLRPVLREWGFATQLAAVARKRE